MKIAFFFLLLSVSIYGCAGSPFRHLQPEEMLENKYISFLAPDSSWEIARDFETSIYVSRGNPPVLNKSRFINLNKNPKGVKYDLDIRTRPLNDKFDPAFFNKNAKYRVVSSDEDMIIKKRDKEQNIGYRRSWITYVAGMKCIGWVFSRDLGGYLKPVSNKTYSINCAYYHNDNGRHSLTIVYRYNFARGSIWQGEMMTLERAELYLKQAVKKVVDSLYIKGFDKELMQREGLYHPEKSFIISPY